MSILIIVFGALMLLAGITVIINPNSIFNLIKNNTETWIQVISAI